MKSLEKLQAAYDKLKEEYQKYPSNDQQEKILQSIESTLAELRNAIEIKDEARILELSIKAEMFLDGFKLFPAKKK